MKSIARKEDKPPETRSDDELRVLLRSKGEQTMQASLLFVVLSYGLFSWRKLVFNRVEHERKAKNQRNSEPKTFSYPIQ